jgi:hypothetical protein
MTNNGRLVFGAYDGSTRTIQNSTALNNNAWHHAVATQSAAGMKLYVDGTLVASDCLAAPPRRTTSATGASAGTTSPAGPRRRAPSNFKGALDEVAVYPYALTARLRCRRTTASARASRRRPPPSRRPRPTSMWPSTPAPPLRQARRRSPATSWDFGDESRRTHSAATPSHTYAASGTYTAKLTVTDSNGLAATTEKQVVVQAANVLPTASFEVTGTGLSVSADASASTDSDGTIASYALELG